MQETGPDTATPAKCQSDPLRPEGSPARGWCRRGVCVCVLGRWGGGCGRSYPPAAAAHPEARVRARVPKTCRGVCPHELPFPGPHVRSSGRRWGPQ